MLQIVDSPGQQPISSKIHHFHCITLCGAQHALLSFVLSSHVILNSIHGILSGIHGHHFWTSRGVQTTVLDLVGEGQKTNLLSDFKASQPGQ